MNLSEINKLRKNLRYILRHGANRNHLVKFLKSAVLLRRASTRFSNKLKRFEEMCAERAFTKNWFKANIVVWEYFFDNHTAPKIKRILEIGSWQGMSTIYMAEKFKNAEIFCVDTWEGADEHKSGDAATTNELNNVEATFDHNTKQYADRISKIKTTSFQYLREDKNDLFDLIYIDGSHYAEDVILDGLLSFKRLNVGGYLIFDDFLWNYYSNEAHNPCGAILYFLKQNHARIKIHYLQAQVILERMQ